MSVTTRVTDEDTAGLGIGAAAHVLPLGLGADDVNCPICVDLISDPFVTPCGHTFCYNCVATQLAHKSSCPSCGAYLTADSIYPNFLLNKILRKAAAAPASGDTSLLDQVKRLLADGMGWHADSAAAAAAVAAAGGAAGAGALALASAGGGYSNGHAAALSQLPGGGGGGRRHSGVRQLQLRDIDAVLEALYDAREELERRESYDVLHLLLCFLHHAREHKDRQMAELRKQLTFLESDIRAVSSANAPPQQLQAQHLPEVALPLAHVPAVAAGAPADATQTASPGPSLAAGAAAPAAAAAVTTAAAGSALAHGLPAAAGNVDRGTPSPPPFSGGAAAAAAAANTALNGPGADPNRPQLSRPGSQRAASLHLHTITPGGAITSIAVDTAGLRLPAQQAAALGAAVQHALAAARAGSSLSGAVAAAGGGGGDGADSVNATSALDGGGSGGDASASQAAAAAAGSAGVLWPALLQGGAAFARMDAAAAPPAGDVGDAQDAGMSSADEEESYGAVGSDSDVSGGSRGEARGPPRAAGAEAASGAAGSDARAAGALQPGAAADSAGQWPGRSRMPRCGSADNFQLLLRFGGGGGGGFGGAADGDSSAGDTASGAGGGDDGGSELSGAARAPAQRHTRASRGVQGLDAPPHLQPQPQPAARAAPAQRHPAAAMPQAGTTPAARAAAVVGAPSPLPPPAATQQQQQQQHQHQQQQRLQQQQEQLLGQLEVPEPQCLRPRAPITGARHARAAAGGANRAGGGGTATAAAAAAVASVVVVSDPMAADGGDAPEPEAEPDLAAVQAAKRRRMLSQIDVLERAYLQMRASGSSQVAPEEGAPLAAAAGATPPGSGVHLGAGESLSPRLPQLPVLSPHGAAAMLGQQMPAASGAGTGAAAADAGTVQPGRQVPGHASSEGPPLAPPSAAAVQEPPPPPPPLPQSRTSSQQGSGAHTAAPRSAGGGTTWPGGGRRCSCDGHPADAPAPQGLSSFGAMLAAATQYSRLELIAEIPRHGSIPSAGGPGGPTPAQGAGAPAAGAAAQQGQGPAQQQQRAAGGSGMHIVSAIEFDAADDLFAIAGVDPRILVYDYQAIVAAPRRPVRPVVDLAVRSRLCSLSYCPAVRQHLLSADFEGVVTLWDTVAGTQVEEYDAHERRVWAVDFSPPAPHCFASGSDDGLVKVWSTKQPPKRCSLALELHGNVCAVEWHPTDPHLLAIGTALHTGVVYDIRRPAAPLHTLLGHRKAVSYIRWLPNRPSELVTASTDSSLKLWSLSGATPPPDPLAAGAPPGAAAPPPGGAPRSPPPLGASAPGSGVGAMGTRAVGPAVGAAAAAVGPLAAAGALPLADSLVGGAFIATAVDVTSAPLAVAATASTSAGLAGSAGPAGGVELVRTFGGHTNERNFVGLSVWDDYIACGSETHEAFVYYRSIPQPALSFSFAGRLTELDRSQGHFITALQWRRGSQHLLAANSAGHMWMLGLQL